METPLCSDDGGPTGPFLMLLKREEISQRDLILVFMQIILILPINPTDFTEIPIMLMICSRWCYSGKLPFVIWSPSFSTPSRFPLPYKVFSTPSTMITNHWLVGLLPTFVIWSPGSTSLARLTPMMAAPFNDDVDDDLLSLWHGLWWWWWRRWWLFRCFWWPNQVLPTAMNVQKPLVWGTWLVMT